MKIIYKISLFSFILLNVLILFSYVISKMPQYIIDFYGFIIVIVAAIFMPTNILLLPYVMIKTISGFRERTQTQNVILFILMFFIPLGFYYYFYITKDEKNIRN